MRVQVLVMDKMQNHVGFNLNRGYSRQRLGDLVEYLVVGAPVARTPPDSGVPAKLIQVRSVPPTAAYVVQELKPDALEDAKLAPSKKVESATVREGDLVLVARGVTSPMRLALVGAPTVGAVASSNLIVIRPRPAVISGPTLALYFSSAMGQRSLQALTVGSVAVASLSVRALERLEVPVPPAEVAAAIDSLVMAGTRYYDAVLEEATVRAEHATHLAERLLHGGSER